jgi:PKD repeat protein
VWDFGDGSPDYVGQVMTHRYSREGTYAVKLVVTNECESIGSTTRAVVVKKEEDTGTIRCTSNQSSFETFIDDVSVGSSYGTKLKVVSGVPVGSHEVKIEKGPGYTPESCTETVRVSKDDTVSVDCQMEKTVVDTATLTIQEVHGTDGRVIHGSWTVEIWVDGLYTKCQGAQTLTFGDGLKCDCSDPKNTPCEFGNHLITLKKAGYKDLSASVDIKAGDAKTWYSPVMEAGATGPPHDIDIVAPVGSTLRIDGIVITSSSLGRLITSLERLRR